MSSLTYRTCLLVTFFVIGARGVSAEALDGAAGPSVACPTFAPGGQLFTFVTNVSGEDDIWVAFRDGTGLRPLVSWAGSTEGCPDWSPDGGRLVFESNRGGALSNIWSVDAGGANASQLTSGPGHKTRPRYSPDGTQIAFLSNVTGKRELWLMKADGTNQRVLKLLPEHIGDPAWSPSGNEIAYVACTNALCSINAISVVGGTVRQMTSGPYEDWHPDWSVNGIVFASNRNGSQGLWAIDSTGLNLRPLTAASRTGDLHPRWESNSSSRVIFERASVGEDAASSNIWLLDPATGEQRITRMTAYLSVIDTNGDGKTDCADIAVVRASFGSRAGQTKYSASADINHDGIVDVRDLALVSKGLPAGSVCR